MQTTSENFKKEMNLIDSMNGNLLYKTLKLSQYMVCLIVLYVTLFKTHKSNLKPQIAMKCHNLCLCCDQNYVVQNRTYQGIPVCVFVIL